MRAPVGLLRRKQRIPTTPLYNVNVWLLKCCTLIQFELL
jgi:hypothetical protein